MLDDLLAADRLRFDPSLSILVVLPLLPLATLVGHQTLVVDLVHQSLQVLRSASSMICLISLAVISVSKKGVSSGSTVP